MTYIGPAFESAAFGTEENIFKVELHVGIDTRHFPV